MPTIYDVTFQNVFDVQQAATMRLHLTMLYGIHTLGSRIIAGARSVLDSNPDEPVEGVAFSQALNVTLRAWSRFISDYTTLLARGIRSAAALPLGALAVMHHEFILQNLALAESRRALQEQVDPSLLLRQQHNAAIDTTYRRKHEDGLDLSRRLWQLDTHGRGQIHAAFGQASEMTQGELANALQETVGARSDCAAWVAGQMEAAEGETSTFSPDACQSQGLVAKAARLSRTELQESLNTAAREVFASAPWIALEKINLSPLHPAADACDDVAGGGENGEGVYPVGEVILPIHPNCLCYRTPVLDSGYNSKLSAYLAGRQAWPEMDRYAVFLRVKLDTELREAEVAGELPFWAWGAFGEIVERVLPGGGL